MTARRTLDRNSNARSVELFERSLVMLETPSQPVIAFYFFPVTASRELSSVWSQGGVSSHVDISTNSIFS